MLKILNDEELKQFIKNENIPCSNSIISIILDVDNSRYLINGSLFIDCDKNTIDKYL